MSVPVIIGRFLEDLTEDLRELTNDRGILPAHVVLKHTRISIRANFNVTAKFVAEDFPVRVAAVQRV